MAVLEKLEMYNVGSMTEHKIWPKLSLGEQKAASVVVLGLPSKHASPCTNFPLGLSVWFSPYPTTGKIHGCHPLCLSQRIKYSLIKYFCKLNVVSLNRQTPYVNIITLYSTNAVLCKVMVTLRISGNYCQHNTYDPISINRLWTSSKTENIEIKNRG